MRPYMEKDWVAEFPAAMAYVPWQYLTQTFENLDEAFNEGTIFPELWNPLREGGIWHDAEFRPGKNVTQN